MPTLNVTRADAALIAKALGTLSADNVETAQNLADEDADAADQYEAEARHIDDLLARLAQPADAVEPRSVLIFEVGDATSVENLMLGFEAWFSYHQDLPPVVYPSVAALMVDAPATLEAQVSGQAAMLVALPLTAGLDAVGDEVTRWLTSLLGVGAGPVEVWGTVGALRAEVAAGTF